MNKIAERLRDLRVDNGKEREELAIYLNVTVSAYNRYEAGTRTLDPDSLIKIAIFYGVTLDYLMGYDEIDVSVFNRRAVYSYRDLVELGMDDKLAHGIIKQIDSAKPFEERIRRSVDDKTKFVKKEEVKVFLQSLIELV